MENKKIIIFLLIIVFLVVLFTLLIVYSKSSNNNSKPKTNENLNYLTTNLYVDPKSKRGEVEYTNYNTKINLNDLSIDGSGVSIEKTTITILKAGVYYLTGSLNDGNIVVNAGDEDNVVLVFDEVDIKTSNTSCINVINAKKIYINLVEGTTNTFTDSSNYTVFTNDDEPDATIFSKTDLFINGKGTLIVNANYLDGIVSKDELVITNANIEVNSNDDAITGKDCVDIKDTSITVTSKQDGIKATNDTDVGRGYVIIENSTITINVGDDGIHAEKEVIINSGTINIDNSHEGIEGLTVQINGGDINIKADDDGINGAGNNSSLVEINGGNIYIDSNGDGLDSNGSISMKDGNVIVAGTMNAENGAIDYEKEFSVNGGSLIVYGGTGMWQNTSNTSSQYTICFSIQGNSGDSIRVTDSDGYEVANFKTNKSYSAILISNSNIQNEKTYKLYVNGDEKTELKVTSIVSSQLNSNGFMRESMDIKGTLDEQKLDDRRKKDNKQNNKEEPVI